MSHENQGRKRLEIEERSVTHTQCPRDSAKHPGHLVGHAPTGWWGRSLGRSTLGIQEGTKDAPFKKPMEESSQTKYNTK